MRERADWQHALRVVALLRMALDEMNADLIAKDVYQQRDIQEVRLLHRNLGYVTKLAHDLLEKVGR
jgi:cell division protein FtsX